MARHLSTRKPPAVPPNHVIQRFKWINPSQRQCPRARCRGRSVHPPPKPLPAQESRTSAASFEVWPPNLGSAGLPDRLEARKLLLGGFVGSVGFLPTDRQGAPEGPRGSPAREWVQALRRVQTPMPKELGQGWLPFVHDGPCDHVVPTRTETKRWFLETPNHLASRRLFIISPRAPGPPPFRRWFGWTPGGSNHRT